MKRKLKFLEYRRLQGARLLIKGVPKIEIARRLNVSRQSVQNWASRLTLKRKTKVGLTITTSFQKEGAEFLEKAKSYKKNYNELRCQKLGRPKKLSNIQIQKLKRILKKGAKFIGYQTDKWSLSRLQKFIQKEYLNDEAISRTYVLSLLKELNFSCQKPKHDDQFMLRKWERFGWIEI